MQRIFSPAKSKGGSGRLPFDKKKMLKLFAWAAGAVLVIIIGVFIWLARDLPSPGSLSNRAVVESTKIYDRTGQHLLYDVHGEEKRTQIPFAEMPENVRYATIALEDQDFYNHHGIEIKGIIRAALKDVINLGAAQGGSTITQQLIKNSMLTSERTITRKIKEVILALELEQKYSKDEIMAMYLNEIPYGSNAYGIEAAAQTFFGKHAKELTLPEAALLASLPNAPTYYSPYGSHLEALKARQELALQRMADQGYITQGQANEAKSADVLSEIKPNQENIGAPHFVMYVKEYLEKKYGEQTIEQGGLKVYTTLDWDKQQAAEEAVRNGAANNVKYKAANAALVAMDPKTGQILAMVGSKDFFGKSEPEGCLPGKSCRFESQVNVAVRDRQPGSSIKPFVYLTAFQKGYTPETLLWDVDTNFGTSSTQDYTPKDYDGKNRGPIEMKDALAMSLNIPAVETLYLAGVKNSLDTAHKLGITTLNNPDRYGLSLVLGGGEVQLLDHVNAYSTLATGGVHHNKTPILKIEDAKGSILEEYKSDPGEKVMDEKYVAMLDYIMSTNDLRAPIFGTNNPLNFNGRVAAKTGTTNEWRDGWTMGYTPSIAVGVWAGNNDNSTMAQGADGIYVAAPIFRAFMDKTLGNYSAEKFPEYKQKDTGKDILDGKFSDGKDEIDVCEIPGHDKKYCLANDSCPNDTKDKKKFSMLHSILYYVDRDNPQGDPPADPGKDPQFDNWEKAVRDYVKDHKGDFSGKDVPTEQCKPSDFGESNKSLDVKTTVSDPDDGATVSSSPFTISARAVSGYDITNMTITVDGNQVASSNSASISASYDVPDDKKNTILNITVIATDKKGRQDSDKLSVRTNIQ